MPDGIVRPATEADAAGISSLYAYYVENSTATFETEPPDTTVWQGKIAQLAKSGFPFLVYDVEGDIRGYAYVTLFRDRPAYAKTCESSVYVRQGTQGAGIGKRLMTALVDAAAKAGFEQMIAVIASEGRESVGLHEKLGFVHAGRMRDVGIKFGQRLDTIYMQRDLREEV